MGLTDSIRRVFAAKEMPAPAAAALPEASTPQPAPEDTREISSSGEDLYARYHIAPYHPDDLLKRKGGLKIYDQMRTDEQVKACLNLKKMALLGPGWSIEPASDEDGDKEIAAFVDYVLRRLPGTLKSRLRKILSAVDYGFSVTEKVWEIIPDGPYAGKIGLKALKTRRPHTWGFLTDEHGNILPDGLHQQLPGAPAGYPVSKFIVYSYGADFDDADSWYGVSDLRAAYRSWWSKDLTIKFWNIFNERFGMPTVKASYKGSLSPKEEADLEAILDNIQSRTGLKVPEEKIKLELLEAVRQGQAGYEAAVKAHDTRIARALLIPEKLGFTDSDSGSYNLGEKHFDLFLMSVDQLKSELEETIMQEQVIRQLVDYNFPGVERYPQFRIGALAQEGKNDLATRWQTLTGIKVLRADFRKDLQYMRREQGLPELTDDEWEEWQAQIEAQRAQAEELARARAQAGQPGSEPQPGKQQPGKDGKEPPPKGGKQFTLEMAREPTTHENKLDLQGISQALDSLEADGVAALAGVVAKQRDALLAQVTRLSRAGKLDARTADKLQLKYVGDFRAGLQQILSAAYQRGGYDAAREIGGIATYSVPEEALPTTPESFFAAKAFAIAGIEREEILKQAKIVILNHIKNGTTLRDVIFKLQEIFKPYVLSGEIEDGQVLTPARLENIVRTNVSEAYNEARKATFRDPEVADFVPAYQYSAILDQRTTPFCRAWDGYVALATDPVWDKVTPPNHFMCRSILVPVTKGEPYQLSASQPAEEPQKGFFSHPHDDYWTEYWERVESTAKELMDRV